MIYWPTKPAVDRRDYGVDWGPLMSKRGATSITNSVWTKIRGTATDAVSPLADTAQRTYRRISGGTANAESVFRNTVTFNTGEIWSEDCFLKVRA